MSSGFLIKLEVLIISFTIPTSLFLIDILKHSKKKKTDEMFHDNLDDDKAVNKVINLNMC